VVDWVTRGKLPGPPAATRRAGDLDRPHEHVVEHLRGQLAREGVLLARVKAAEQRPRCARSLRAVPETRPRPLYRSVGAGQGAAQPEPRVPGEGAEADDDGDVGEQLQLAQAPRQTFVALLRGGPVGRRGA